MDPATLTAAFAGLAGLLTAAGGVTAMRARSAGVSRRDYRRLERRHLIALGFIFTLKEAVARSGQRVPPDPDGLYDDDDQDGDPPGAGPGGSGSYARA